MSKINCFGHLNGFKHVVVNELGINKEFDLGYKFLEIDPELYTINSNTGVKSWVERRLVLYISAIAFNFPEESILLQYALTRSKYSQGKLPTRADQEYLLEHATKRLYNDIITNQKQIAGDVTSDFIML